jgi:rRNA maturation RNase YbeY
MESERQMELQIHNFPEVLRGNTRQWEELSRRIVQAIELEPVASLNLVFVDDPTLQKMHQQYLNDPEKTDVITFDLSDGEAVEGEIYISIDRAREQAKEYGVSPEEEVLRLIVHGILHLKGYDDLEEDDRKVMKAQEDAFVQKFRSELP